MIWRGEGESLGREGGVLAGRYRLLRELGRGDFGEVWAASDTVTGRDVAVKLLFAKADLELSRGQMEVLSLRQGLLGVVELLDEGSEDGQAFLVMELVDGRPFPGCEPPCTWEQISGVAVALLTTVGRVHAAFVVHRDLKPANVLVTPDGHVRLLDFGIAQGAGLDLDSFDGSEMLGPPKYKAPEQVGGSPPDERTDLYAIGVMLYEALSGRLPHEGKTPGLLLSNRLTRPPLPLSAAAPETPPMVARLIDRMVATQPEDRPASANEVLAALRGDNAIEETVLLWLGSQAALDRVVQEASQGRSIDVVGPRGHGRTRLLLAARERITPDRIVHLIQPAAGDAPLECLAPLTGPLDQATSEDASAAERAAEERVRAALARAEIVLVDDFERLDPLSRRVLSTVRGDGAVVRALLAPAEEGGAAVTLAPLTEKELRSLFAGPDRLLHLREDAARVLHERTGGVPAHVFREVQEWLSLGIVRRTRGLLVVSRSALDRLSAGLLGGESIAADIARPGDLSSYARETWIFAGLAWPHATITLLAELTRRSREEIHGEVDALSAAGLVHVLPDGRIAAQGPPSRGDWTEARVRAAHGAIARALPPGAPSRLHHLLLSDARDEAARLALAREAAASVARLIEEGRLAEAMASVETGIRAVRELGKSASSEKHALLALGAEAAFDEHTPQAANRLLHALYRVKPHVRDDAVEKLALAMAVEETDSDRAMQAAMLVPVQADARLERLRVRVLMRAARLRGDDAAAEALLDDLSRSAVGQDPEIAAHIEHARGRLRYRCGDFLGAAELHVSAARTGPPLHRIDAMCAAAWALIEAFELDRAEAIAEEARALAARHRHATYETYATWSLRAVAYRKRATRGPDMELVGALPHAVGQRVRGIILFTEAAVAWRAGHPETRGLAQTSWQILSGLDEKRGSLLMRCLLIAVDEPAEDVELVALHERAMGAGDGIGIQALGLLAMGGRLICDRLTASQIEALAGEIPRAFRDTPIDVLSVNESLEAIHKVCPGVI